MDKILRFYGAVKREPEIDAWLNRRAAEPGSPAKKWFHVMRECGPDVCGRMHDGAPTVCVENAPFAYVNVFKDHVNAGFFYGVFLNDSAGLLEDAGKRMRHVKLRLNASIDPAALKNLIFAAYSDIKNRPAATR